MMKPPVPSVASDKPAKRENLLINLTINVLLPAVVLMQFSSAAYLGATLALIVALSFPLLYGQYSFIRTRSYNILSISGTIGVLTTAGIGLLRIDPQWLAVKEAAVPFLMGLAVLISMKTPAPLLKKLVCDFINVKKVYTALQEKGSIDAFEQRMVFASYLFAASFFVSAGLNYLLAKIIVSSPPGTEAFNQELGRMTAISVPVIGAPTALLIGIAALLLIHYVKKQTGMSLLSIFR